ncbi:MAG: hypothetical protein DRI90_21240 [Deltaproteobacteria bacterium]|nr:MAG: hypothetical protein DRI90_21240 [Deltaproteobacteria bacterium]
MRIRVPSMALRIIDDLVADGRTCFTFAEAVCRSGRSRTATANLLRRMADRGLIDRVRRGHYAVRQFGVLGTDAAAEDVALAVGAAFAGRTHRIGYRSALDEHDLIAHPARTIQVAAVSRTRATSLSRRPLRVVIEPEKTIAIGARASGASRISDLERALLDAAARPALVGGAAVLAEAVAAAGSRADPARLMRYAQQLSWTAALRRIGSLVDALEVSGLKSQLEPILPPQGDIELEPAVTEQTAWRDPLWRVRWAQTREELANVAGQ